MTKPPAWRRYLTFWRSPVVQDVDDELRFHTNMRVKEYMARGLSEEEARRAVGERLGDVATAKDECVALTHTRERNARNAAFFDALRSDLRYALRGLRAKPGFTAAVVITLALGFGANAAVFSVVDRLLFRTAPFLRDAGRTHRIFVSYPSPNGDGTFTRDAIPYVRYKEISDGSAFARTAAYAVGHSVVGVPEEGRDMQVAGVSASFFTFFDAPPRLGRYFGLAEDGLPAGEPVVVLSYATWQTEYGGREDVLGSKLQIGRTAYTIIGIAPRSFSGLWPDEPPVAYIPFSAHAASLNYSRRGETWWTSPNLDLVGLLMTRRRDVSLAMATTALTNQMRARWTDVNEPNTAARQPTAILGSTIVERGPRMSVFAQVAALVGAMSLVVLLIAGANVANLLLARALRRSREIAVRLALGISRRRLVAQMMTETILLALLGGIAGLVVARWGGPALRHRFLQPSVDTSVVTDIRTLMFVGTAVVLAGVLTGLAPALQAGRLDVTRFLRLGAREGVLQRSPLRASLLVIQGALSVLLLIAAGLFVRSLDEARRLHMGYDVDRLLIVGLNMRGVRLDSARLEGLWQRLTAASRVPGVERVAVARDIPLLEIGLAHIKRPPSMDSLQFVRLPMIVHNIVMPGFFETVGTRILRGRALDSTDVKGSASATVVSSRFAQTFWPGQEAIGQCVMAERDACMYVVGVAEDVRYLWMNDDPGLQVYTSAAQNPIRVRKLFVRTGDAAKTHAQALRAALQREMPQAAYVTVTPYSDIVGNAVKSWQLGATVFVAFGALAMLLATVGLYSAIAYNVTQRTHEMGVRRALGAQASDVIGLVVKQGVVIGGIGVVIGGAIAWGSANRLEPLLFRVSPRDPFVFVAVLATMLVVVVAASFVPARRAASVDPNVALRAE
jgi:predicted permease